MKGMQLPIVTERFLTVVLKVLFHSEDISAGDVRNIKTLFDKIDMQFYSKDPTVYALINSVIIACNSKLQRIDDIDIITTKITTILSNQYANVIEDIISPVISTEQEVSTEEANYVLKAISHYLKHSYLMEEKDHVLDLFVSLSTGAVYNVEETIDELKEVINKLNRNLILSETSQFDKTSVIHTSDPEFFEKHFAYAYKMSKSIQRVLKMGLKMLNEMLSDELGLLLGKMYVINAPTNSFKTTIMMYMALWIQRYNSQSYMEYYKKTGIRPTVLFVSLENTWDENTARFFSMSTGKDFSQCENLDEAVALWKKLFAPDDSIIDVTMVYAKANRLSPQDLENIIDDIESQGYKVIALIVDYMKIMRSDISSKGDKRQDLIQISTDLHELVVRRGDFTLITAHHTNRDGDKNITDMKQRGIVNQVQQMGREHLTEAHSVEEPIDYSMYILPEESPFDGKKYITFKKGKCRYNRTAREGFVHELINGFLIKDDIMLPEGQYLSMDKIKDPREKDLEFKANVERVGKRGVANLMVQEDNGELLTEDKPEEKKIVSAEDVLKLMKMKKEKERQNKILSFKADDYYTGNGDGYKPMGEHKRIVTESGLKFVI